VALVPSADVPSEVPERLLAGLTVLEERPELPAWFSESAIENVQKIGKLLHHPGVSGMGLTAVMPSGEKTEARLTPEIIEHAGEAFQGTDEALADAIRLSSAIRGKAERFMTWDAKDFPIGRVVEGATPTTIPARNHATMWPLSARAPPALRPQAALHPAATTG
jgi:hypothetical protein